GSRTRRAALRSRLIGRLLRLVNHVFRYVSDTLCRLLARGDGRIELLARGVAVASGLGDLDDAVPYRTRNCCGLFARERLEFVHSILHGIEVPNLQPLRLDLLVALTSGSCAEYVSDAEPDDESDLPLHGVSSRCSGRAAGVARRRPGSPA